MEEIYHNECDCLFADNILDYNCRKRYFDVYDIFEDEVKRIFICNEHLRLSLNNVMRKYKDNYQPCVNKTFLVGDIVEEIIFKYLKKYRISVKWNISRKLSDIVLNVRICDRPSITHPIKLLDAIDLSLMNNGKGLLDVYIIHELTSFLNNTTGVVKYKSLLSILKKIQKTHDKEEKTILYNQLFLETLKFKKL